MKALLSVSTSAWVGVGLGAIVDDRIYIFWGVWAVCGILLAVATWLYISERRLL